MSFTYAHGRNASSQKGGPELHLDLVVNDVPSGKLNNRKLTHCSPTVTRSIRRSRSIQRAGQVGVEQTVEEMLTGFATYREASRHVGA